MLYKPVNIMSSRHWIVSNMGAAQSDFFYIGYGIYRLINTLPLITTLCYS